MFIIKEITETNSLKPLKILFFNKMNAAKSMKRNYQDKREILEFLSELRDSKAVKQKQAAVLQRLDINLSWSSLFRLEITRDQSCIKQVEIDWKSDECLEVLFS